MHYPDNMSFYILHGLSFLTNSISCTTMLYQYNYQTYSMRSLPGLANFVVAGVFQDLIDAVWVGVAQLNIQKRLALKAAHLEFVDFMSSYINNGTSNKQIQVGMHCQTDPTPIQIDNLGYGQLQKQKTAGQPRNAPQSRITTMGESISRTRTNRFTLQQFHKKKGQNKDQSTALITLPEIQDPHYVEDPKEDDCRKRRFRVQKERNQGDRNLEQIVREREENGIKNKKLLRDLKKYTYDYQGKFFGVGGPETKHHKAIRIEKKGNGEQSITKKETKIPQCKSIGNDKIKERENRDNRQLNKIDKNIPQFDSNRPQSLLDLFEGEDRLISEGVKLVSQKGNQQVIKEKPQRKRSGLKKYRRSEYQGMIKDIQFQDFKMPSSKKSPIAIDINKTAPIPIIHAPYNPQTKNYETIGIKASLSSNSQVSLMMGRDEHLPPIQSTFMNKGNQIGIKRRSVGYQGSQRSLISHSGVQSIRSKNYLIRIDDQDLYNENFR